VPGEQVLVACAVGATVDGQHPVGAGVALDPVLAGTRDEDVVAVAAAEHIAAAATSDGVVACCAVDDVRAARAGGPMRSPIQTPCDRAHSVS